MNGLCTRVWWVEEQRVVVGLRTPEGDSTVTLGLGDQVAFELVGTRQCVGYRTPGDMTLHACPDAARDLSSAQCASCMERAHILPCLRCTGERCNNPVRRDQCVRPENHAVYLASFGPGMPKVGVAQWPRRLERLAEQGARAAIIIARDDGQQVRRVEAQFRRCGIPDRYAPTEKLRGLTQAGSQEELVKELITVFQTTQIRTVGKWLKDIETVELPDLAVLAAPPRLVHPSADLRVRGTVRSVCGQTLIIDADTGEQVALETPSLAGYQLRLLEDHEYGEAQLSLALL